MGQTGHVTTTTLPTAAALLASADLGSARWWRQVATLGTPLVEEVGDGHVRVTFLYREASLSIRHVYIDVNGVTDHHSYTPQSLARIAGTDVWSWQVRLPSDWRGSYAFMPATMDDRPPMPRGPAKARQISQKAWWIRTAAAARADPLNTLRAHPSGWGGPASAVHLPDALDQSAWREVDLGSHAYPAPPSLIWHSVMQGKRRTIWHHCTGLRSATPGQRDLPLVLLLDGQNWLHRMPLVPVLDVETAAGRLPPALYLFIDAIDGANREEDLTPNPVFWSALWEELVPMAATLAPITRDSARRVVAGQSYGGLAAIHAVLDRPDRWGAAIAQSPSLWWPDISLPSARIRRPGATGDLTRQLRSGAFPPGIRRVFMEVGSREDVMIDVARTMLGALERAGHETRFREYQGGHDALCWRGGLIDGLRWLLPGTQPPYDEDSQP